MPVKKHDIVAKLLARGLTRGTLGRKKFWREYSKEYRKLPQEVARLKARRELLREGKPARRKGRDPAKLTAGYQRELLAKRKGRALPPMQLRIAVEILAHKKNAEIEAWLDLKPRTVRYHITCLYARCGVGSREQFIALWSIKRLPPKIQAQLPEPPKRYALPRDVGALPKGISV